MLTRIDGRYVHKVHEANVLIASVKERPGQDGWYDAEMVHDMDHPFFFEHPLDHIPAMMLVEAGRQLGIAISHLFLGVPMGTMFASRSFELHFTDFAEKTSPVVISVQMSDKQVRKGELIEMRMVGHFSQDSRPLGSLAGSWSMLRPEVWKRYRRREQQRVLVG